MIPWQSLAVFRVQHYRKNHGSFILNLIIFHSQLIDCRTDCAEKHYFIFFFGSEIVFGLNNVLTSW
mgnify:FL=1